MASCAVMDIEDYETPKQQVIKRNVRRSLHLRATENGEDEVRLRELENSNIPGVGSIFLKTWGCSHNHSDAEYMAGQLAAYGYSITGIFIFNITSRCACLRSLRVRLRRPSGILPAL